jgi:hypothetical protein
MLPFTAVRCPAVRFVKGEFHKSWPLLRQMAESSRAISRRIRQRLVVLKRMGIATAAPDGEIILSVSAWWSSRTLRRSKSFRS